MTTGHQRPDHRAWVLSQVTGTDVLDLGGGLGRDVAALVFEGLDVLVVDPRPAAVATLEQDVAAEGVTVKTTIAALGETGLDGASVDTVVLCDVVHDLARPRRAIGEALRVLRPAGRVIVTVPFAGAAARDAVHSMDAASFVDLMAESAPIVAVDVTTTHMLAVLAPSADGQALSTDEAMRALQPGLRRLSDRLVEQVATTRTAVALTRHLEHELERTTKQLRVARAELAAREQSLTEKTSTLDRVRDRLSVLEDRHVDPFPLRARIAKLEHDRWVLRTRLDTTRWKLRSLRQRRLVRAALVMDRPRSGLLDLLLLPLRMLRALLTSSDSEPRPERRPEPPRTLERPPAPPPVDEDEVDVGFRLAEASHPVPANQNGGPRVAAILDTFSLLVFGFEFDIVELEPDTWADVLARQDIDLLLVESAWRGKNGRWMRHLANEDGPSAEVRALVQAFRDAGIPTVFWNKEDPPNFDLFIEAAGLFDHVFTVAEELVPTYRELLGHDNVGVLPFAAQPYVHNPRSVGPRHGDIAFAGTYYATKHPDRAEQMQAVLDPARSLGLDIFSRVASSGNYAWPDRFEPNIVGSLPYGQLVEVHKQYKVFTNVNSVIDSESMCARRVFELAACNTPVVSGVSPAITRYFGDTVAQVETPEDATTTYRALLASEELRARTAHRALRIVMREHTAQHRAHHMLSAVGLPSSPPERPLVSLVVPTNRPHQLDEILENVGRQTYDQIELVVAAHGWSIDETELRDRAAAAGVPTARVVPVQEAATLGEVINRGFAAADGPLIGKIDDDNYYGAEYTADLVDAFAYSGAEIVGKWTHYTYLEGSDAMVLRFTGNEHRFVELVAGSAMIVRREVFDEVRFPLERVGEDTVFLRQAKAAGVRTYSADRFNYVYMRYADSAHHTFHSADVEMMSKGQVAYYGRNLDHVTV